MSVMQSLKLIKFNIWILGIPFIINTIDFISILKTEHTINWLRGSAAIGFFFVFIMNWLDLKNKNYKTK